MLPAPALIEVDMIEKKMGMAIFVLLLMIFLPVCSFAEMPAVERTVLSNKLTVLVFEDHSIPAVTLEALVGAGSWRDPPNSKGVANLTVKSILVGAGQLTFDQINDRLDFLGANLDADCTKDYATLTMQVLKKDLDGGFDLFMNVLTAPSFPATDVGREKDNIVGKLRSLEDQPYEIAVRAFDKALFLDGPYASQVEGTEESLAAMGPNDLQKFYKSFYRPNNSIIVVGGDITPDEVRTKLIPRFQKWEAADIPEMKYVSRFAQGSVTVKIDKPVTQATILIGSPSVERAHKDYYSLAVLNQILGSGELNSRLMTEIRVKAGLAYSVNSIVLARKNAGSFRVAIQTKNASARESIALAIKELERIRREPVSEAELAEAKKFLIGNFPLRYASTQQDYTKFRAQIEFFGLGNDYPQKYPDIINSITAEDVRRVAEVYLKPTEHVMVVVADLEKAGMK